MKEQKKQTKKRKKRNLTRETGNRKWQAASENVALMA